MRDYFIRLFEEVTCILYSACGSDSITCFQMLASQFIMLHVGYVKWLFHIN